MDSGIQCRPNHLENDIHSIHFNSLCGFSEKIEDKGVEELSILRKILQGVNLFYLNGDSKDFLPKQVDQKSFDEFSLPFNSIAVEDSISVIVINQINNPDSESGFKRIFWEYKLVDRDMCYIGYGETCENVKSAKNGTEILMGKWDAIKAWIIFNGNGKVSLSEVREKDPYYNALKIEFVNNSHTAIQELLYACQPNKFILEITPNKIREPKKNRIPRFHERKIFTMLEPGVIRKKLGLPTVEIGGQKSPHERRGHWRTLTSEFYKEKRGQRIWIGAIWVGPSEAMIGNKLYKVRLDL